MSEKNTLIRGLHDAGLAAWFGGSLMGVIGALLAVPVAAALLMLHREVFLRRQDAR